MTAHRMSRTPAEYRLLATQLQAAGWSADAEVCEIMAQEAERLARHEGKLLHPIDEQEEDEPMPLSIATPHGQQFVLPGMEL